MTSPTTPSENPGGTSPFQPGSEPTTRPVQTYRTRAMIGLAFTLFGLLVFLFGAQPSLFGLDRSPVVGFVQISVFLIGLAIICLGGYASLVALWMGQAISIAADIGLRLVATGYVIAVFSGLADVLGIGSQSPPKVPFFGPWQARGVELGQVFIGVGFLLLLPYTRRKTQ